MMKEISTMTTTTPKQHIHHDMIVEWAKNPKRKMQFKLILSDQWIDMEGKQPNWSEALQYRFTPEVVTITYRRALMKRWSGQGYMITNISLNTVMDMVKHDKRFVKWLGDPITETIEI